MRCHTTVPGMAFRRDTIHKPTHCFLLCCNLCVPVFKLLVAVTGVEPIPTIILATVVVVSVSVCAKSPKSAGMHDASCEAIQRV